MASWRFGSVRIVWNISQGVRIFCASAFMFCPNGPKFLDKVLSGKFRYVTNTSKNLRRSGTTPKKRKKIRMHPNKFEQVRILEKLAMEWKNSPRTQKS